MMSMKDNIVRLIENNQVETVWCRGSKAKSEVKILQNLLYHLGYKEELNWERFGADGGYGQSTVNAVKAFAQKANLDSDGSVVSLAMAKTLLVALEKAGDVEDTDTGSVQSTSNPNISIRESVESNKTRIYVSDGTDEVRFTQFKKGVYYFGKQTAVNAIEKNMQYLQAIGMTNSAMNVMIAVSENEGNLDAINTWDNSFMTFGMFQWTIGAGNDPGELAALISKIKAADPELFERYYGQFGLDIEMAGKIAGYFKLNGQLIKTAGDKEKLRTNEWAFYFWKSGQDPQVQSFEILHALSRLDTFYKSNSYKPNGFFVSDLITSEYGVGLVLDNHVNRPGYIKPCLETAMNNSGLKDPASWGTKEEMQLINEYIKVRATYGKSPMTDANKRATVTKKYLDKGIISAERNSFQL